MAEAAGVSLITASRILNPGVRGTRSGSQERRRKVQDAAQALGYTVNPAAQTIAVGAARTIALIVTDIRDFGSATIMAGVMAAAESRGMSVAVRTTHDDPVRELEIVRALRGERHRGVIIATSRTTDEPRESRFRQELSSLEDSGARVVVIGDSTLPFARVTVDTESAAAELATQLALTHHRIAILAGPEGEVTSLERVTGFEAGLAAAGLSPIAVMHGEFSRDGGYAAVYDLQARLADVDLVAAMSDAMAVGAIVALNEIGFRVPDEMTVSGFDNVPLLADLLPGFSTVAMPLEQFGEACLDRILEDASDRRNNETVRLRADVIVRPKPHRSLP
ncbi:LacI family transcriptional regulator [Herbiconiux sp. CPCC 205716]|uniref:LacI family transcriptional regulator n=1 Tax=Herbiconiux gentiana TaxID=2970912 RepID=A0ABT2GME9_9MICO|nr:LacI family DNA-binding transcriptional regulator [Herbiconiux gentiana]MCS5716445.1 LacI family transcriptional regulator [Herbiconiux gentiana]